jgi:hypothetical protein
LKKHYSTAHNVTKRKPIYVYLHELPVGILAGTFHTKLDGLTGIGEGRMLLRVNCRLADPPDRKSML